MTSAIHFKKLECHDNYFLDASALLLIERRFGRRAWAQGTGCCGFLFSATPSPTAVNRIMDAAFLTSAFEENHYPPADKSEVAFSGRSNVGKSSLLNILVNRKNLARTSSTPGRTQALNFFLVDGRFYFVDLPGYGYARVPLEVKRTWRRMVGTYLRNRPNLKAVVVIVDIRRDLEEDDREFIEWLEQEGKGIIPVLTKVDKLSRRDRESRARIMEKAFSGIVRAKPIFFSARTGEGRKEIWDRLLSLMKTEGSPGRRL